MLLKLVRLKKWCKSPFIRIIAAILTAHIIFVVGIYLKQKPANYGKEMTITATDRPMEQMTTKQLVQSYLQTNEDRVRKMREYCHVHKVNLTSTYPNFERLRRSLPGYVWLASSYHELFYCATPKCASTTWKLNLMKDLGVNFQPGANYHYLTSRRLGIHRMLREENSDFMQFLETYRPRNRLVIVRNPWARLVSAYEDKVINNNNPLQQVCLAADKYNGYSNISFNLFIDCLTNSRTDVVWNFHINPFTSLCAFCHMDYNIIVKLEEMHKAELFIKETLRFKDKSLVYTSPEKGKYNNKYASHYRNLTADHIKRLQEIYKEDIKLFDYPASPFE